MAKKDLKTGKAKSTTPPPKKGAADSAAVAGKKRGRPAKAAEKVAAKPTSALKSASPKSVPRKTAPLKSVSKSGVSAKSVKEPIPPDGQGKARGVQSGKAEASESASFASIFEVIREGMKNSNSIRMFKNPVLEKWSHVHPLVPIFIYVPVVLLSIYFYFQKESTVFFAFLIFYIAGGFTWTMVEYTLHRFLFHPPFSDSWLKGFYFYVHGVHHETPTDATRLVMPPGASIPLAVIFFFIFRALLPGDHLAFYSGFVSGYLVYDFLHFSIHFFSFQWLWFKNLKKHHGVHHFNAPGKNFGVSNSLWDHVFSTKYRN